MGRQFSVAEGMAIRSAVAGDADAIVDVWLRSRASSFPAIPPTIHSDHDVHAWFADVVLPTCEVWVSVAPSGQIVALLVLNQASIDQLYVDPDWFGRGIGSCLVELAKERRVDGLVLWTFQSNHRAGRFYERHGFDVCGTTAGDNEEGAPDMQYRWGQP